MGLDLNKMKAKLAALKGNGGGGTSVFWKPQEGEQTIRILPTADGDPFKDYHFHYMNINGKNHSVMCPKRNFGESCPICDFASNLWNEGQNGTPGAADEAKKLFAKQRFFSPVIVRGEEDKGVRLWGYGKTAYKELLNLVLNPEYGDSTDVNEGTDLVITYGKPAGAQFPQTTITPRRKSSPLAASEDEIAGRLDEVPDFNTVFEGSRKTPQEVQGMLDSFLLQEEDAEEMSTESSHYNKSTEVTEVDAAFNELLGA